MEAQNETDQRKQRGLQIAKTCRINKNDKGWVVPSQSGMGEYLVTSDGFEPQCTCPDYENRRQKCKHVFAVEFTVKEMTDIEGNVTIQKTVKVSYSQDWSAYDQAQTHEKELFLDLLYDLCGNVENPQYVFGRPKMPLSDMIFASALKVYSTFSLRRFTSDMQMAKEKGFIDKTPHYSTVALYMEKPELTPILKNLIEISSLPLKSVELKFAVDSTGFSTLQYKKWYDFKYGKEKDVRIWKKAHIICGTKTNIVTAVNVTNSTSNDCPHFPSLVNQTGKNFQIFEVSADKAYCARYNMNVVDKYDALPYIPFKSNAKRFPRGSWTWRRMYHYFMLQNERFMEHYHNRSNIESTVHMIKSKFGTKVRSKTETAQVNEILLKVLCHNICVVIQEMHELGIKADFKDSESNNFI